MPKVSIIVPIYNAEKYVDRCIQSILKQSYKDFELLLMDDGSKDSSGEICDRAAAADDRVRVIHKENSGVSDTRNQGLKLAKGEYIQFLDADDWITENATELFVHAMENNNADMVISDFYRVNGENVAVKGAIETDGLMTLPEFTGELIARPADFYYGVLWNKFFRRSVIREFNIHMDENISWCEDFIFNLDYFGHCKNIFVLKVPVYYYVKTEGSLVSQGMSVSKTVTTKQIVFKHYSAFCQSVFGAEEYEKRRLQVYRYFVDMARDGSMLPSVFPNTYKLGEERTGISEAAADGEGIFYELYREKKLYERQFEVVAYRNHLSEDDVKLLYFLSKSSDNGNPLTGEEAAEILNTSLSRLSASIRKLRFEGLIELKDSSLVPEVLLNFFNRLEEDSLEEAVSDETKENRIRGVMKAYVLTEDANKIMDEILFVMNDFEQMQFERVYRGREGSIPSIE